VKVLSKIVRRLLLKTTSTVGRRVITNGERTRVSKEARILDVFCQFDGSTHARTSGGMGMICQLNSSLSKFLYMSIVYCYRIEQVRTFKDDDESRTELDYSQLIDGAFLDNVLSRM
jgi:hypothetical protein